MLASFCMINESLTKRLLLVHTLVKLQPHPSLLMCNPIKNSIKFLLSDAVRKLFCIKLF